MYPSVPIIRTKLAARRALDSAVNRAERLVTDVEVLQEILHRFVVDETLPIDAQDVRVAKRIVLGGYPLSARDAVSFDRGFDRYLGVTLIG